MGVGVNPQSAPRFIVFHGARLAIERTVHSGVVRGFRRGTTTYSSIVKDQEMTKFVTSVKDFLVSEDGPTAVEYAIMLALIVIVCIGAVQSIGTSANAKFGAANTALNL